LPSSIRQAPRHQWQVHASRAIGRTMRFDASLYRYGWLGMPALATGLPATGVPARTRLDVQWSRRLSEAAEWAVGGQNLLGDRNWEYTIEAGPAPIGMRRAVYTKITWRL